MEETLFLHFPQEPWIVYIDHRLSVSLAGINILCAILHDIRGAAPAAISSACVSSVLLCLGLWGPHQQGDNQREECGEQGSCGAATAHAGRNWSPHDNLRHVITHSLHPHLVKKNFICWKVYFYCKIQITQIMTLHDKYVKSSCLLKTDYSFTVSIQLSNFLSSAHSSLVVINNT